MKNIKRLSILLMTVVILVSFVGCNVIKRTEESKGKTVLAKVDGEKITRAEVDQLLYYTFNYYRSQYGDDFEENEDLKETIKSVRTSALESLIEEKVLMSMKDDLGVNFDNDEIKKEVDEQVEMYKSQYSEDGEFEEFIASYGYDEKGFEEFLTTQVKLSKIIEAMVADVTVSDEEIQEYYNENIDSYKLNPGADVQHIVFTDETTGEADAKAARELVLQGKTFDEIAAMDEYKDKCKAESLGHQDFENNTLLVSEFVDGFKNLPEGQVSEPVKTSHGWHLILNTNINTETVTESLDEVKDEIKNTILYNKKNEEYTNKLEKYKEEMNIKIYEDKY